MLAAAARSFSSISNVARQGGLNPGRWSLVGYMAMLVGYLIATYYCVIAGWTLSYIFKAGSGFGHAEPAAVAQQFDDLLANPEALVVWHTVFMAIALFIVGRGLKDGIEKVVTILMPLLFAMLLLMIGYAAVAGDFGAALSFLFSTDFSKIDSATVLVAIGQAFFSISVAMGLLMTYGSYVPKHVSLTKSALIIAGADTLVAVLAGLMIFPLVFGNNLDPGSGPGLIFQTLPTAFAEMPGGVGGEAVALPVAGQARTTQTACAARGPDRTQSARSCGLIVTLNCRNTMPLMESSIICQS